MISNTRYLQLKSVTTKDRVKNLIHGRMGGTLYAFASHPDFYLVCSRCLDDISPSLQFKHVKF